MADESMFQYGKITGTPGDLAFFYGSGLTNAIASGSSSGGGTVGLDKETKEAILKIAQKLEDGTGIDSSLSEMISNIQEDVNDIREKVDNKEICNCDSSERAGMFYYGIVDGDPTEEDEVHLIQDRDGNDLDTPQLVVPRINMMVEYHGGEFLYRHGSNGLGWHEIGEENWESQAWN